LGIEREHKSIYEVLSKECKSILTGAGRGELKKVEEGI